MYPDTANVEALVNRYFINDEPGLVREMGAKFRISGHTHMPHEAVVGKTTSIGNRAGYPNTDAPSRARGPPVDCRDKLVPSPECIYALSRDGPLHCGQVTHLLSRSNSAI